MKWPLAGIAFALLLAGSASADDGYDLWLKYKRVDDEGLLKQYREELACVDVPGESKTLTVIREELRRGLAGLLGADVRFDAAPSACSALIVSTPSRSAVVRRLEREGRLKGAGSEGYRIASVQGGGRRQIVVAANSDIGLLHGVFHFLRLLQTHQPLDHPDILSSPRIGYRLLDHWDNLDGSIERGYAGKSLWKWSELPGKADPRYSDYARANASIGINGAVLNNVNANPVILTAEYLRKVAALAEVFRPYGIRVFLSVNFASPTPGRFEQEGNRHGGIGNLSTADPLDPRVRQWWKKKAKEIYGLIPDFGGFLVKASSEGMPGPQDYGRNDAEGANMLAGALAPFGGVVMWRAFVYNAALDPDRVKRAALEFVPLDGLFRPNVFVQAKNGPLDFQPREPVQPLFGSMTMTPLMLELQLTQEYLGHSTHLVYLGTMWHEYLQFDLFSKGPGSTLAKIIDGSLTHAPRQGSGRARMTGIAGVANTGDDRNWCGHFFAQANWYAFGRLAWDPALSAGQIADEWTRMSLTNDPGACATISGIMMVSREACVNYMEPLGLHHIMEADVHYGPGPQNSKGREDWTSVYYHRADSQGVGFDRSPTGSNAAAQYAPPLRAEFDDIRTCPEKYLLWFHHVGWNYRLKSGRTLWEELCVKYYAGTDSVEAMYDRWRSLKGAVDPEIFSSVLVKLEKQRVDAAIWRDTCLAYFQKFSGKPILQRR